jgi:flagellar motor switch protein FliN/FliY
MVSAVLGTAKMQVCDLLKLKRGSIVELERRVGDPVDIYVNNRLIAKGEVVSVDDKLAITLTEVIKILK